MKKEIALKLKEMDKKHLEYVNNPKINEDDDLYNERMILLVHEKQSSWHLYYDPKYNYIYYWNRNYMNYMKEQLKL